MLDTWWTSRPVSTSVQVVAWTHDLRPVRPSQRARGEVLLLVRRGAGRRRRVHPEPHGARGPATPTAELEARSRTSRRGPGCVDRAPGARTRGAPTSSTASRDASAATPTPTSSSTTSPSRGATAVIERTATGSRSGDVGSLNGTYVNHDRVDTSPLARRRRDPGRAVRPDLPLGGEALSMTDDRRRPSRAPVDRRGAREPAATSSPTSRSRRSGSSRARGSSTRSGRRRGTGSSTAPTSTGCAGSCTSRRRTSCR